MPDQHILQILPRQAITNLHKIRYHEKEQERGRSLKALLRCLVIDYLSNNTFCQDNGRPSDTRGTHLSPAHYIPPPRRGPQSRNS